MPLFENGARVALRGGGDREACAFGIVERATDSTVWLVGEKEPCRKERIRWRSSDPNYRWIAFTGNWRGIALALPEDDAPVAKVLERQAEAEREESAYQRMRTLRRQISARVLARDDLAILEQIAALLGMELP